MDLAGRGDGKKLGGFRGREPYLEYIVLKNLFLMIKKTKQKGLLFNKKQSCRNKKIINKMGIVTSSFIQEINMKYSTHIVFK